MKDADEAVGQGTQGSVVGVAGRTPLVVEGPGAGAGGESGEGPQVAGVGQTPVAGVAGQHDTVFARRFRDG